MAFVFSGGIGLGAYQAGAYAALHVRDTLRPDWIAASSAGGLNVAIIAGNPLEQRLERLRALWLGGDAGPGAALFTQTAGPWRGAPVSSIWRKRSAGSQRCNRGSASGA